MSEPEFGYAEKEATATPRLGRLERLLDKYELDELGKRRAKLLSCVVFGFPPLLYFALRHVYRGEVADNLFCVVGALVMLLCAAGAKWAKNPTPACHLHIWNVALILATFKIYDAHGHSLGLWMLPLVPMLGAYLLGIWQTLGYSLLALVCVLWSLNLSLPLSTDSLHTVSAGDWILMRILVVVMMGSAGAMLAYSTDRNVRKLSAQEAQIRRETRASEAAERAKTSFLVQMSTEILAPFQGIFGLTRHLAALPSSARVSLTFSRLHQSARRITDLLHGIIDIAKVEAGALELSPEKVDLAELVVNLVRDQQSLAKQSGHQVVASLSCTDCWGYIDPKRVTQAIAPLIHNAIKYSPPSQVQVHLAEVKRPSPHERLMEIRIQDQGCGLSPAHIERLFHSFERFDDKLVREKGGLGVGLTLVGALTSVLGASIRVDSKLGQGSTFTLSLRLPTHAPSSPPAQDSQRQGAWVEKLTSKAAPEALASSARSFESSRLKTFCLIGLIPSALDLVESVVAQQWFAVSLSALSLVGLGSYVLLAPKIQNPRPWSVLLVALGLGTVFTHGVYSGQLASSVFWMITLVPIVAAYLMGLLASVVTMGVACALILVMAVLDGTSTSAHKLADLHPAEFPLIYLGLFAAMALFATLNCRRFEASLRQRQAQGKIAHAQALAADRSKSKFLADASHELRTPMNGVFGLAEHLLDEVQDPKIKAQLHTIYRSAGQLTVLLNGILDSSRVEAGQARLCASDFDMVDLLGDAALLCEMKLRNLRPKIQVTHAIPQRRVHGDPARLMQVIIDLVVNAVVNHASRRGMLVRLSCLPSEVPADAEQGESNLEIWVHPQDTKAEELRRQFPAERRDDKALASSKLSGSSHVVKIMGGHLTLSQISGSQWASAIRVTLPHAKAAASTVSQAPAQNHHVGRVLVVDDNAINRKVASLVLEKMGWQVSEACNGQEAVDKVRDDVYALVLMDVRMPVMDGIEATRVIRGMSGEVAAIPILALTADGFEEQRKACLSAGMSDHLAKPFRAADLRGMVARHVPMSPARQVA